MKKTLLIILSILICLGFSSCNSVKQNKVANNITGESYTNNSKINDVSQTSSYDGDNNYHEKEIKSVLLETNGTQSDLGIEFAEILLKIESFEEVEDLNSAIEIGTIIFVYDNGDEENFCDVIVDKDKCFYLRKGNKDKAITYKLGDSSFINDFLK